MKAFTYLKTRAEVFFFTFALTIALNSCSTENEIVNPPNTVPWTAQPAPLVLKNDCAYAMLMADKTLWMWGTNNTGTLGSGKFEALSTPHKVINIENVAAFDTKMGLSVAADENGDIWMWGKPWVAPGLPVPLNTPTKISHLDSVTSVMIGVLTVCDIFMLKSDGSVYTFKPVYSSPANYLQPKKMDGFNDIVALTESYALRRNGTITGLLPYPILHTSFMDGINGVKQVSSVYNNMRTFILKNDGTVWGWGTNQSGQLGDSTFTDKDYLVQVKGLTDIKSISTSYDYNLALKGDGTVWFWGIRYKDENLVIHSQLVPSKIDITDAACIAAGSTCMIAKKDGSLYFYDVKSGTLSQVMY